MKQNGYEKYVKERTPVRKLGPDMAKAFVTGGVICVIGQGILNYCEMLGLDQDTRVVLYDFGAFECDPHRNRSVSEDCRLGRSRCACADYGICQLSSCTGNRV